jgi:immunity protein 5 of polymorphic toxin system
MSLHTTHNLLKAANICRPGFERFTVREALIEKGYDDDSILPLSLILEVNGLDDAVWALRAVPEEQRGERDRIARLFACDCAEHVLRIYEAQYPGEERPRRAIEAARRFALDEISHNEMKRFSLEVKQAPKTRASLAARATTKRIAQVAAVIAAQAAAKATADREAEGEFQSRRLMEYLTRRH